MLPARRLVIAALAAAAAPLAAVAQTERICTTPLGWCEIRQDLTEGPSCTCTTGNDTVRGLVVEATDPNPLSALEMPPEVATRGVPIGFATRTFAGPSQVPPAEYRAYGLVVFKTRPSKFNRDRFMMICDAYASALAHASEVDVPKEEQMVTVWPVSRDDVADRLNPLPAASACDTAVDNYGLVQAQNALRILDRYAAAADDGDAYDTGGRGPFLVAWTPGARIARPDSVALLVDLSHVDDPQHALKMMTLWHDKIQDNPDLWQQEAVGPTLVDILRRFFDDNGAILEALGTL